MLAMDSTCRMLDGVLQRGVNVQEVSLCSQTSSK